MFTEWVAECKCVLPCNLLYSISIQLLLYSYRQYLYLVIPRYYFKNIWNEGFWQYHRALVTCLSCRESLLTKELWKEVAPYVLDDVLLNARQRESAV